MLIDVRLEPQRNDMEMIQWLGENGIPFVLVFTKSDKLGVNQVVSNVAQFKRTMKKTWTKLPEIFITSTEMQKGRDAIIAFIEGVNAGWRGA